MVSTILWFVLSRTISNSSTRRCYHCQCRLPVCGNRESVNFECRANGDPEPVIIWTKIDGELPITVEIVGGLLTIPQVQLSHSGLYKCTATNAVGSRSSEVLLYVQASSPRRGPYPSVPRWSSRVLRAVSRSPRSLGTKKTRILSQNDFEIDSGVLTLRNVKKEDAGTYVCSATNKKEQWNTKQT
ncbi:putative basement membrane-specific heparan sulfate proteoglycan core protein [Apostichopus japonicus]|uniref:Putative basement membrane-specific heparan sulfate proteoglycan core protein n=1 Tax=Stichopus japonicus TaxID=307972 RepID=A0A2G8KTI9_STIJA|nr:putative basement membrane-specific heparan sulfate proteoglycan core protein [Apostichopus japonicus]